MERLGKVSWVKKTEEMCLVHNNLCDYCRAVYTHSFLTLWNPMVHSLLGSNIYGILQARILECIAIFSTRVSSQPRDHTPVSCISCTAGGLFTTESSGTPLWLLHSAFTIFIYFSFWGSCWYFLQKKNPITCICLAIITSFMPFIHLSSGFPGGSMVKNPPANAGDMS